ncbi:MAG TPA: dienelactone hydrolase family protein, partial [Devosia sp.]|nr:dienelactone hydrolase family protein [Devosia sp.]
MRIFAALALVALLGSLPAIAPALADEQVSFPSAASSASAAVAITGELSRPAGTGPFPAVVLLHSCLGYPSNRHAVEDRLAASGYVALFVDDFAARGLSQTCLVDFPEALADAFGALAYLAGRPDIDPARIAAVGFSQGGDTALAIASTHPAFAVP